MSEAYQKARGHYALASGLLIGWDLIRVTIDRRQEVAGITINVGAPDAAPIAMIAFMTYCAFRTVVEWFQCDRRRRQLPWSRIDMMTSHVLGVTALSLFVFQRVSNIAVGQYLAAQVGARIVGALLGGALIAYGSSRNFWFSILLDEGAFTRSRLQGVLIAVVGIGVLFVALRNASPWYLVATPTAMA